MSEQKGKIPSKYIKAESMPEAYYKVLKVVHEEGYQLRTQYDRKEGDEFIDPPGKDTKFFIEITDLFAEPRIPKVCYCEWGKYIAEFLGAKDHLVVPYEELLEKVKAKEEFSPTIWPYCYHQRLTAYPCSDGSTMNQLDEVTDKLAGDPLTRRAVAMTGIPEIDLRLKEDLPCFREYQFRLIEDGQGRLVLNTDAKWRSRDNYKAWPDNVIGVRNQLQFEVVPMLQEKIKREIIIGPYTEENGSLHIYGQDYTEKGMDNFFEVNPTLFGFLKDSQEKQEAFDGLIIDELKQLKTETTWNFPKESLDLIDRIIEGYESGKFTP